MNIVSINQDAGISEQRQKGAALHLRAIRQAFEGLGHRVVRLDETEPARLQHALSDILAQNSVELIYERYALGKGTAADFAATAGLPYILEVNAPLAEEAAAWRGYTQSDAVDAEDRRVFRQATAIIAVTRQTADYAVRRGADPERVTVCPNGVDIEIFKPRDRAACKAALGIDPDAYVLGFHGRLRPWHAFQRLVAATAELLESGIPAHLLTAGEGPYLQASAGRIPASHHTHIAWLEQQDLGPVVSAYDLLPLMYEADAPCYFSPLKLYEAMASGAIPVVPLAGDLEQLVEHGVDGIVYENGSLTLALRELWDSAEHREGLREAAIRRASGHTWATVASRTLAAAGLDVPVAQK